MTPRRPGAPTLGGPTLDVFKLGVAAVAFGGGACVAAPVYNPGHVPPAAMRRIEQACAAVVRLPAGSAYDFGVCEESLSRSLAARADIGPLRPLTTAAPAPRADRRERERRACGAIGFEPPGLAFGQCVADLDAALAAADRPIM